MLKPLAASQWSFQTAAHLLNRAGFGGTPEEIRKLEKLGLDGAVSWFVDYEKLPDPQMAPAWAEPDAEGVRDLQELRDLQRKIRQAPQAERKALEAKRRELARARQRTQRQQIFELRGWWLGRMARGPRPLQERLTLFWHGHFATSVQKVKDACLMFQQNETFRRHASGNWREMLTAVTKDPAMLIWLDQAQSRKNHPNENFAREVMELFTLGEGHYTEKDITEAARAFTGLTLDRVRQEGLYRPFLHDAGEKTVLGRTGKLDWMDVLEQIVAQPQAARFIAGKLWRFFASEDPSEQLIATLAAIFRANGNNFKPMLRAMFRSEEFYAPSVIRNQVKSPVQWLVGSVRMLERELPPALFASNLLQNLGQDLFAPPNVKGWDGGIAWITTNNLLARYNYAEALVHGEMRLNFNAGGRVARMIENRLHRRARRSNPVNLTRILTERERSDREALIAALEQRLLQGRLKPRQRQTLREYLDSQGELDEQDILEAVRLIMSTPEFQLT